MKPQREKKIILSECNWKKLNEARGFVKEANAYCSGVRCNCLLNHALYAGFCGATLAVLWQGLSETFHISIGEAFLLRPIVN